VVSFLIENDLKKKGFALVAGVDEAGRGPLAGPVFAAAVILPSTLKIKDLDDSKKLSAKKRDIIFSKIIDGALSVGVGVVDEKRIDEMNILQATFAAMRAAINGLSGVPDYILVDGNKKIPDIDLPQRAIIGGDGKCSCIAAASVVAKVLRDRYMQGLHKRFPDYGFDRHKGYGTRAHFEAIKIYGPSSVHRSTFLQKTSKKVS